MKYLESKPKKAFCDSMTDKQNLDGCNLRLETVAEDTLFTYEAIPRVIVFVFEIGVDETLSVQSNIAPTDVLKSLIEIVII